MKIKLRISGSSCRNFCVVIRLFSKKIKAFPLLVGSHRVNNNAHLIHKAGTNITQRQTLVCKKQVQPKITVGVMNAS